MMLRLNSVGIYLNYHAEFKGNVAGMNYIPASQVDFNADGKL